MANYLNNQPGYAIDDYLQAIELQNDFTQSYQNLADAYSRA